MFEGYETILHVIKRGVAAVRLLKKKVEKNLLWRIERSEGENEDKMEIKENMKGD